MALALCVMPVSTVQATAPYDYDICIIYLCEAQLCRVRCGLWDPEDPKRCAVTVISCRKVLVPCSEPYCFYY